MLQNGCGWTKEARVQNMLDVVGEMTTANQ